MVGRPVGSQVLKWAEPGLVSAGFVVAAARYALNMDFG